jgi:hypothetical protein
MTFVAFVRQWARRPVARFAGVCLVLSVVAIAAAESLKTIGAIAATNTQLRTDLRSAQAQTAAVLRSNRALAAERDSVHALAGLARARADTIARRAASIEADAATIRAIRATKPPIGAQTATDSIASYRDALASAEREAELLRDALEQRWDELAARDSVDRLQRAEITLLRSAADSATAQLVRVQPLLIRADAALGRSQPRCRIARVVPCPSRTVAFVAGSVVTAAVTLRLTR